MPEDEPKSSEPLLDLPKLKAGDDRAWVHAIDILFPIAKAAAMAAVNTRTETESKCLAVQTLQELRKCILKIKNVVHLKAMVATIASNRSIDLLRKDTGKGYTPEADEPLDAETDEPPDAETDEPQKENKEPSKGENDETLETKKNKSREQKSRLL